MKIEKGGRYRMRNGHIARALRSQVFEALTYRTRRPVKVTFWFGRCETCNEGCSWNAWGRYGMQKNHGNDLIERVGVRVSV